MAVMDWPDKRIAGPVAWGLVVLAVLFSGTVVTPLPVADPIVARSSWETQRTYWVRTEAERIGLDPDFALRVSRAENWNADPAAVSPIGCCVGVMQIHVVWLTSRLIQECGTNLVDMQTNACFGVRILRDYLEACEGDRLCALHRYVGATSERGRARVTRYVASVLEET